MPKLCVECSGPVKPARVEERVNVAGKTFTASLHGSRCARCGASYLSHEELGVVELAAAGELARHGVATAETFGFMRRALGIKALELANLLDVTPETISRWERGRQPLDRRAVALLASMVLDRVEGRTSTLDRLRAFLKPSKLPKVVRLTPRIA